MGAKFTLGFSLVLADLKGNFPLRSRRVRCYYVRQIHTRAFATRATTFDLGGSLMSRYAKRFGSIFLSIIAIGTAAFAAQPQAQSGVPPVQSHRAKPHPIATNAPFAFTESFMKSKLAFATSARLHAKTTSLSPRTHRAISAATRRRIETVAPVIPSIVHPTAHPSIPMSMSLQRPVKRGMQFGRMTPGPQLIKHDILRKGGVNPNLVDISGLSSTGDNSWWTYEQDAIPGVGSYRANVSNGNLLVQAMDLNVPNRGLDLVFNRVYNSKSSHNYNNGDGSIVDNFGNGWTNSFDAHIAANNANPSGYSVFDVDGNRIDYVYNPSSGLYIAPPGVFASLTPDGTSYITWTKLDGTVYHFWNPSYSNQGEAGRLDYIRSRNSNTYITFAYSFDLGKTPSGQTLNQMLITAEDNRQVVLQFGDVTSNGLTYRLLADLVWPDAATRVNYFYDQTTITQGLPDLTEVDEPGNNAAATLKQQYAYGISHMLEGILTPRRVLGGQNPVDGLGISFAYDSTTGRLTTISYDGVVNPIIPDGNSGGLAIQPNSPIQGNSDTIFRVVTLTYGGGITTSQDTDGHISAFTRDAYNRVTSTQLTTGNAVPTLTKSVGWNSQNEPVYSIDVRGKETDYAYDPSGKLIAISRPLVTTIVNGTQVNMRSTELYTYDNNNNVVAYCDPATTHNIGNDWNPTPAPTGTPGPAPSPTTIPSSLICPSTIGNSSNPGSYVFTWTPTSSEPLGELTSTVSPMGYTQNYTYSSSAQGGTDYGLLTDVVGVYGGQCFQQAGGGSRLCPQSHYTYNLYGNLSTVAYGDASNFYSLGYGGQAISVLGRLSTISDPDNGTNNCNGSTCTTTSYTSYYANGQVALTETPAQHAIDALDFEDQDPAPGGVTYLYDADYNETQEYHNYDSATPAPGATPAVKTNWYDGASRLVETEVPHDERAFSLGLNQRVDVYPFPWLTRYIYDLTQGGLVSVSGSPQFTAYGNNYATQELLPVNSVLDGEHGGPTAWVDTRGRSFDALDRVVATYSYPPGTCVDGAPCQGSPSASRTSYDVSGALGLASAIVDPLSQTTNFSYDTLGRVSVVSYANAQNPTPTETYGYDPDGRAVSILSSTLGTQSYGYDPDGRLSTAVDPSVNGSNFPATLTYAYYPNGLRESVSAQSNQSGGIHQNNLFAYQYRNDGARVKLIVTYGATYTFGWTYTPGARELSMSDPFSSSAQTLSYEQYGRVLNRGTLEGTYGPYSYDPEDNVKLISSMPAPGIPSEAFNYSESDELYYASPVTSGPSRLQQSANGFSIYTEQTAHSTSFDRRAKAQVGPSVATLEQNTGTPGVNFAYDVAGDQTISTFVSWTGKFGQILQTGTLTKSYDATRDLLGSQYAGYAGTTPTRGSTAYTWGPNGHPITINDGAGTASYGPLPAFNDTLHWDGNSILFTQNSQGQVDDIKIEDIGDITPTDAHSTGLTVFDRDQTSAISGLHNGLGHSLAFTNLSGQVYPGYPWAPSSKLPYIPLAQDRSDGYSDGQNVIQGARSFDPQFNGWSSADANSGNAYDPMSQSPYVWNRNNPASFSDPSGTTPEECQQYNCLGIITVSGSLPGGLELGIMGLPDREAWLAFEQLVQRLTGGGPMSFTVPLGGVRPDAVVLAAKLFVEAKSTQGKLYLTLQMRKLIQLAAASRGQLVIVVRRTAVGIAERVSGPLATALEAVEGTVIDLSGAMFFNFSQKSLLPQGPEAYVEPNRLVRPKDETIVKIAARNVSDKDSSRLSLKKVGSRRTALSAMRW